MLALAPIIAYITTAWLSLLISVDSELGVVGLMGPCAYGYCHNIISSSAAAEDVPSFLRTVTTSSSLVTSQTSLPFVNINVPDFSPFAHPTVANNPVITQRKPTTLEPVNPAKAQPVIYIPDFTPMVCSKTIRRNPPSKPLASFLNVSVYHTVTSSKVYTSSKKARLEGAMQNHIVLIANTLWHSSFYMVTVCVALCFLSYCHSSRPQKLRQHQRGSKTPSRFEAVFSGSNIRIDVLEVATVDSGEILINSAVEIVKSLPEKQEDPSSRRPKDNTESEDNLRVKLSTLTASLVAAEATNEMLTTEHSVKIASSRERWVSANRKIAQLEKELADSGAETERQPIPTMKGSTNLRYAMRLEACKKELDFALSEKVRLTLSLQETTAKVEKLEQESSRTEARRSDAEKAYQDLASSHKQSLVERASADRAARIRFTPRLLKTAREQSKFPEADSNSVKEPTAESSQKSTATQPQMEPSSLRALKPRLHEMSEANRSLQNQNQELTLSVMRDSSEKKRLQASLGNAERGKGVLEDGNAALKVELGGSLAALKSDRVELEKKTAMHEMAQQAVKHLQAKVAQCSEERVEQLTTTASAQEAELKVSREENAALNVSLAAAHDECRQSSQILQEHIDSSNEMLTENTATNDKALADLKSAVEENVATVAKSNAQAAKAKAELVEARSEIASLKAKLE